MQLRARAEHRSIAWPAVCSSYEDQLRRMQSNRNAGVRQCDVERLCT